MVSKFIFTPLLNFNLKWYKYVTLVLRWVSEGHLSLSSSTSLVICVIFNSGLVVFAYISWLLGASALKLCHLLLIVAFLSLALLCFALPICFITYLGTSVYCAYNWQLITLLMLFAYGKLMCTILRSLKTVGICSTVLLFYIWSYDLSSVISWKY